MFNLIMLLNYSIPHKNYCGFVERIYQKKANKIGKIDEAKVLDEIYHLRPYALP